MFKLFSNILSKLIKFLLFKKKLDFASDLHYIF